VRPHLEKLRSLMEASPSQLETGAARRILQPMLAVVMLLALAASFLVSGGQAAAPASGRQGAMASLQEVTITLQDGVSPPGYVGTSDSYMELYYPNKPGQADVLRLKAGLYHSLLRFDLSPLPAGAEVLTAMLWLYSYSADNSEPMVVEAYQVLYPWVDTEVTWNSPRTGESWTGPGCTGSGTDRAAAPCSVQTLTGWDRWYDFDVTSVVGLWASGAAENYGLVLAPSSGLNSHRFRSANANWEQYRFRRPKLMITYRLGGDTPTPTATASATHTTTSVVTATPTPTVSATASATHTMTPVVTATATASRTPVTPSATRTPDRRRTPVPDSLYPYPEQRVGFVAFDTDDVDMARLHAGFVKFQDRGPKTGERSLGFDFCTVLRVGREFYEAPDPDTYWAWLEGLVSANPGHLWFIGN